jgi:hypothetical protein
MGECEAFASLTAGSVVPPATYSVARLARLLVQDCGG